MISDHIHGINNMLGAYNDPCICPQNICTFQYWRAVLATKIISQFDFTMPATWPELMPWWLVINGWCAVVDTGDKTLKGRGQNYGIIPIIGTLAGQGVWNEYTQVMISQPLVSFPKPLRIGSQVGVLRMSPFYTGVAQIVNHYAQLMTLADNAIDANLLNSRIGHVFAAPNPSIAKSVKTVFEQIMSGEPAVVNTKVADGTDTETFAMLGEPGKHVITDKLLENQRVIMRNFCRDVGIHTGNENKRERLTEAEVEIADEETERLLSFWLRHIKSSMDKVNKMYGLNLSVTTDNWNYDGGNSGEVSTNYERNNA